MDQEKIEKFIASCRKKQKLTQEQLAEKLGITYKAVSKWETGKGLPDASIMKDLCNILKITVNELLSGELIDKINYDERAEVKLLEMLKQKEEYDKILLRIEIILGMIAILPLLFSTIIVLTVPLEEWLASVIVGTSIIPLLLATPFALRIEQTAGYYECRKCNNRYIPTYISVFHAMHLGRTRYMKCPKCGKHSWNKKVISRGNDND